MAYYDVLLEHTTLPEPDSITVDPYCLMIVWRYANPVTFSRKNQASVSKNPSDSTALRNDPLIIVDDIRSVQVKSDKTNHVGQFSATLTPGMNYLTEMFPGDWIGIWMIYGKDKLQLLMNQVQGLPTNGTFNSDRGLNQFDDGLKFIGKLTAIRKKIIQSSDGRRMSTYSINGSSFTEFDATIYFEPYLASNSVGLATDWLQKTGININNVIATGANASGGGGGTDVNLLIPELLSAFYKGLPQNQGFIQPDAMPDTNVGLSNPNSFIIPSPVAQALGVSSGTKTAGQIGWCDICTTLIGVQDYTNNTINNSQANVSQQSVFVPNTLHPLLGTFLPSPPQFDGQKTVWAILEQFKNQAVNETYATLRVDSTGVIKPTYVLRQLPFNSSGLSSQYKPKDIRVATDLAKAINSVSTPDVSDIRTDIGKNFGDPDSAALADAMAGVAADPEAEDAKALASAPSQARTLNLTRFITLPRWRIHPILIKAVDFGRSDSLRFNFIHVYAETGLNDQNRSGYIVRDPPVRDDLDIIRNGLRPFMLSVNTGPADAINRKAGDWMYILSDILMGQHLTLSGSMDCQGIQSPIAIGDNIEFDEHIFHIEAISHSFTIQNDGRKSFSTSLALSHGQKYAQLDYQDASLYAGTSVTDLTRFDSGISPEYQYSPTKPSTPSNPPLPDKED